MASVYYMVTGVDKTRTGSYDTYFDTQTSVNDSVRYAYIGIRPPVTPRPEFTFISGSRNNFNQRDLQMYTPYPAGTERGKLYLVTIDQFGSDPSVPGKSGYVQLEVPTNVSNTTGSYFVLTPTLYNSSLSTSQSIALYQFDNIDDLWNNGWRISNSQTTNQSIPVMSQANWDATKNSAGWTSGGTGWDPNAANPVQALRSKEQILAAMFACTELAYQIQDSLSITDPNKLHGALVIAGSGSAYDNGTWNGVVPITGSIIINP